MAASDTVFDEQATSHYEAWYETPEGQRADSLEKVVLRWLLRDVCPGKALEVGCGTGHFSHWLRDQDLAVVGLDLSSAMLAEAKALGGLPLVQGDAYRLPFADATFDLSVLITTLEFLSQPQVALTEAVRVAQHGVVLGVLNRWSLLGLQRRLAGLWRPSIYNTAHFYGVGELKRWLRSVADRQGMRLIWRTTLLPGWGPWSQASLPLPWGGVIGMALLRQGKREDKRR
jgi:SAM-dependent methyltransferase